MSYLFQLAEIESSRAGKVGMEVGFLRERIIISLLIYKFGDSNVETEIPITEPEVDVKLFEKPLSIKTITGSLSGIKLIWTVGPQKAREFLNSYVSGCGILLIHINWGGIGQFSYIPVDAQRDLFNRIGKNRYIKLPKPGTNPRGVEIRKEAMLQLLEDIRTKTIEISWQKTKIDYNPYKRWLDYWREL